MPRAAVDLCGVCDACGAAPAETGVSLSVEACLVSLSLSVCGLCLCGRAVLFRFRVLTFRVHRTYYIALTALCATAHTSQLTRKLLLWFHRYPDNVSSLKSKSSALC